MKIDINKVLDYGNCVFMLSHGKEAYVKDMNLRAKTVYKAGNVDELAQHSEVFCSTLKERLGLCIGTTCSSLGRPYLHAMLV